MIKTTFTLPAGTRVYAYCRVSPGDEQTIANQVKYIEDWAAENHVIIVKLWQDEHASGSSVRGRTQFLAMYDALQAQRDNVSAAVPVISGTHKVPPFGH